jgi:putative inorganic carbon (HCO3(-)) transporter
MSAAAALSRVRSLTLGSLVARTVRQPASFVLTSLYVFFEYVRPQATYPVLNVLPWARIALIGALIACAVEGKGSFSRQRGWGLLLAFTLVIFASIAQAVYPSVGLKTVDLWLSWLVIIFIISSAADTEERLILLVGGFLLWNFKMSFGGFRRWAAIGFQFRDWGLTGPSGWFQNSGEFGIEMCVFFPIVIYFLIGLQPHLAKWKVYALVFMAVTAVASMAGSSSRGALVGGAAVGLWFLWRSPNRIKGTVLMGALAIATWVVLPDEQKERFRASGDDRTSQHRLTYWADGIEIANDHPVLGIGYDNWMPYYTTRYNPDGQLPHNIFIEAAAELGYVGLFVFVGLISYVFWENYQTRRVTARNGPLPNRFLYFMSFGFDGALIGYLVSGFFVTVLFYPYFWVNMAFTMALATVARRSVRAPVRRVKRFGPIPGTARFDGAPVPEPR